MCLAIPARLTAITSDRRATVDILGIERQVALDLTPKAQLGDYLLVHAGFAIEVINEQCARETLDLLAEFPELAGENQPLIEAAAEPPDRPEAGPAVGSEAAPTAAPEAAPEAAPTVAPEAAPTAAPKPGLESTWNGQA